MEKRARSKRARSQPRSFVRFGGPARSEFGTSVNGPGTPTTEFNEMELNRREFIGTLLSVVPVRPLNGLDLNDQPAIDSAWQTLVEDPLVFAVEGHCLTLTEYGGFDYLRRDVYFVLADMRSVDDVQRAAECCQPLCWRFNDLYWDFLNCVEQYAEPEILEDDDDPWQEEEENEEGPEPVWGDPEFCILMKKEDEPWPNDYDGDGTVLRRWAAAVGEEAFVAWANAEIEKWLDEEPSGAEYDDNYFDIPPTGEDYARDYFLSEERLAAKLGVDVVEGDQPGSNYSYAVLEVPVAEANARAQTLGVPIIFRE